MNPVACPHCGWGELYRLAADEARKDVWYYPSWPDKTGEPRWTQANYCPHCGAELEEGE